MKNISIQQKTFPIQLGTHKIQIPFVSDSSIGGSSPMMVEICYHYDLLENRITIGLVGEQENYVRLHVQNMFCDNIAPDYLQEVVDSKILKLYDILIEELTRDLLNQGLKVLDLGFYYRMSSYEKEQYQLVYQNGNFIGLRGDLNPLMFDGNIEVMDLASTYKGTENWKSSAVFYNVIGSKDDKLPPQPSNTSWLNLWEVATTNPVTPAGRCYTDGVFYNDPAKSCTSPLKLLGGHVVKTKAEQTPKDGDGNIFIIPICYKHNHTSYEDKMLAGIACTVVELENFYKPKKALLKSIDVLGTE